MRRSRVRFPQAAPFFLGFEPPPFLLLTSRTLGGMVAHLTKPVASASPPPTPRRGASYAELASVLAAGGLLLTVVVTGIMRLPSESLALAMTGYLLGSAVAAWGFHRSYPHDRLGWGNTITLIRMALVASLLGPVVGVTGPWTIIAVAIVALALDGVDGYLARREQRVSAFGARLDVEVDSVIVLILALVAWLSVGVSPFVILLALPRYLFVLAAVFFPWLNKELPESQARKVICVVQVSTLIALQLPTLWSWLATLSVVTVSVALIWSFGRDVIWLWRSRSL